MRKAERSRAKTQAHNISSRQEEDRSRTACEVGEGEGCEEKLYLERPLRHERAAGDPAGLVVC
jgi:hypothetical protein